MRWSAALLPAAAAAAAALPSVPYDDFHYPSEEPAEAAALATPAVVSVAAGACSVRGADGGVEVVPVGGAVGGGAWAVVGALPGARPAAACVLERSFARWGAVAVAAAGRPAVVLRKSVGRLDAIRQPYFDLPAPYLAAARASKADVPSQLAANMTADGEVDYPSLAATLTPQRDYAEVSNAADVVKFVVTYNGRVKCASYPRAGMHEGSAGGITEYEDLHAPAPNPQQVIFDPADHLSYWPRRFENSKTGYVGGALHIANVGSFSPSVGRGFELVAFAPVTPRSAPPPPPAEPCRYDGPRNLTYIAGCAAGCRKYGGLAAAEAGCNAEPRCGGITLHQGAYELRAGNASLPSPQAGEASWLLTNAAACHAAAPLPRLPGINYSPGVYLRLREEGGGSAGGHRYFYASNDTLRNISQAEFYAGLVEYHGFYADALSGAMRVRLPASDRRQADMAMGGLLGAWSNYVGDQSNYGNGATYWSYGRQDNGSLPLNVLSVEEGMLEWGLCRASLAHLGFYYDNYIRDDGTVNYYTWGRLGDSVSDIGRLASMYVKAARLCGGEVDGWTERYLPVAARFGGLLLRLRAAARANATAPSYAAGMLQGTPEHDWSGVRDRYFYNNNVWALRGMEELGAFLSEGAHPRNATLGGLLLGDAAGFRRDIAASVAACTIRRNGSAYFLPPWAATDVAPFDHMTDGHTSEYANFRFYPETLLADVLPRDAESMLLDWHNDRGGRLGGASRFANRLDDMPTAGWGYGALTNNRTADFHALLYGHMATYQSRGTFHSTEQLAFTGTGWYRDFAHFPNPAPNTTATAPAGPRRRLLYYAEENDVSYCVVSQVIAARLTRWQLVFEDAYRGGGGVWLARAAPRRWFAAGGGGFGVDAAPTRFGRVSFAVVVPAAGTAEYHVSPPPAAAAAGVVYLLRWPGAVRGAVTCTGCRVATPPARGDGTAAVVATGAAPFTASAAWS